MQIVRLYDEVALMMDLQKSTPDLIHATSHIKPIKKLVQAYEIIDHSLEVEKLYGDHLDDPPWDIHALSDLSQIRRELVIYHRTDFNPAWLLDRYSSKMANLFYRVQTRKKLTQPLMISEV